MNHALEILQSAQDIDELIAKHDGASRLASEVLYCDSINIFLGQAINPAHLDPNLPQEMGFKSRSVQSIASLLREKGKEVTVEIH